MVNLKFASGAAGNLWASCSPNGGGGGVTLSIYANKMTALFSGWEHFSLLGKPLRENVAEEKVWDRRPEIRWIDLGLETGKRGGHKAVVADSAQTILEDREPFVNGNEGRTSLEIVNATILSSFEGNAVSFPTDRDAYEELMQKIS